MDNFPIANSFFNKSCIRNDQLRTLLAQFEEALDGNQKVRQKLAEIQPEINAVQVHLAACDQVSKVSEAAQNTADMTSKSVATCYKRIVRLEQLINEVEIANILNYTVKCKEDETIREITLLRQSFDKAAENLDVLEVRSEVKHLRELQIHQESSLNDLTVLERQAQKMDRQMLDKIRNSTNNRNKKIVHILENKRLIDLLEAKLSGLAGGQPLIDIKPKKRPASSPKSSPNRSILLPALDFLTKFMQFKTNDGKGLEPEKDVAKGEQEIALHSILQRRDRVPSPAKQVRFLPSPDLENVHIVNRLSSMSTDDGSVGRHNSGSQRSSQMRGLFEEMENVGSEEEGDFEAEENEEDEEITLAESDEEESSGDEESGAAGAGKEGSTQARDLPQDEESEQEDESSIFGDDVNMKGVVKEPQDKMSLKKNKVEVLEVVTIPPPRATSQSTFTLEDSGGSNFSRFKLTGSQAMDVDEDKQDEFEMEENEDENYSELPMAQPKSTQFKHPDDPMAVSPPSSDLTDSMLNFSEPNREFTDDFWLSNTDDNNTNSAHYYDL